MRACLPAHINAKYQKTDRSNSRCWSSTAIERSHSLMSIQYSIKQQHSMTGWLPPMAVLKDRFEQLTSRATGFGGGH
jgi:hypothetical protein